MQPICRASQNAGEGGLLCPLSNPLSLPPRKAAHPDGGVVMGKPVKQIVSALAGLAAEARMSVHFQSSFTAPETGLLDCPRGQVTLQHSRHPKSCLKWPEAPALPLCLCVYFHSTCMRACMRVCVCVCVSCFSRV